MSTRELALHEEVELLALHDTKGTVEHSMYTYGVAGGLLAELVLRDRVEVRTTGKKKQRVAVLDGSPTGDEVLDEALKRMAEAKRAASPATWVQKLAGISRLGSRVAQGLARRGILREKEEQVLILFHRTTWPTLDPGPEREVVERVRRALLEPGAEVASRTVVLVGLLEAAGMMKSVLEKKEHKAAKDRIEALAAGDAMAAATREAVEAVTAALAAVSAASTAVMIASTG